MGESHFGGDHAAAWFRSDSSAIHLLRRCVGFFNNYFLAADLLQVVAGVFLFCIEIICTFKGSLQWRREEAERG